MPGSRAIDLSGNRYGSLVAQTTTHGKSYSTEYKIWQGMMQRCYNIGCGGYAEYGGRGILVCDEWHVFEKFYADMGPRPSTLYSLDRLDNDGPYSRANCEWRTLSQQQRNRRDTVHLTIDGTTKPLSDWADEVGVPHQTIRPRLSRGWSHEDAVKVPR